MDRLSTIILTATLFTGFVLAGWKLARRLSEMDERIDRQSVGDNEEQIAIGGGAIPDGVERAK